MDLVDPKDPEWEKMWEGLDLFDVYGGRESSDEEWGEHWQYMGTIRLESISVMGSGRLGPGQPYVHQFRHRMHPGTKKREYVNIPATLGWMPESRRAKLPDPYPEDGVRVG